MIQTISIQNPVLRAFLFYSSILIGKMLLMSPLTARWRFKKRVFISSEDAIIRGSRVSYNDEDVERVRRAHQNDLENIPLFLGTGFIYILTQPNPSFAIMLFRIFTISRIIHTYVYAIHVLPQPTRMIVWTVGYMINWYMVIMSISNRRNTSACIEDEKVARIKRAHLNDMENIPIFIAISAIYLFTKPDVKEASLLFKLFTYARIAHTFVYAIWVIPQPARAIAFITGEIVTWYMIVQCVWSFY